MQKRATKALKEEQVKYIKKVSPNKEAQATKPKEQTEAAADPGALGLGCVPSGLN